MSQLSVSNIPHLTTALSGPLQLLEKHFLNHQVEIETWFRQQWQKVDSPIYGSVDLRNAGFKLAPVDMNLFPAGFNNLNRDFLPLCIQAFQEVMEKYYPTITKILLVPENHTRNLFYLESLCTLQEIILKAGYEVRIASLLPDLESAQTIELPSGRSVYLEPIQREDDCVFVDDFKPCLILLNNDLSDGVPAILEGVKQKICPPIHLGWSNRLKSEHFGYYEKIANCFAKMVEIDPWLINPLFTYCEQVDFVKNEGLECAVKNAEDLFHQLENKYKEYQIEQKPFLIVKADAGTYGMNVMTIHEPAELLQLNRKRRTKMAAGKGGSAVNRIILQEGVYTFETLGEENAVAEPVVYMIGHHVVGGFYRVHKDRSVTENLNAPGMHFEPLAFAKPCNNPDRCLSPDACPNRFYAYGVVARLSLLAAALEQREIKGKL